MKTKVNTNIYLQSVSLPLYFLFSLSLTFPLSLSYIFLPLFIHVSAILFPSLFFYSYPNFPFPLFLSPFSSWCLLFLSSPWKTFIKRLYRKIFLLLSTGSRQTSTVLHIMWSIQILSPHVVCHAYHVSHSFLIILWLQLYHVMETAFTKYTKNLLFPTVNDFCSLLVLPQHSR